MSNSEKKVPEQSTNADNLGMKRLAWWCFTLSNIIFCYQLFLMVGDVLFGESDMFRVPVLTNGLIPLALVVVCILISVSQKAETYNTKAAVTMFAVAVVCYLLPSVLYSAVDPDNLSYDFVRIINLFANTTKYFCLAFGYVNMFVEPGKKLKTYVIASIILPCCIGVSLLIAIPEWGITLLVVLVAFTIIMMIVQRFTALSVKQKDMIKAAVVGDLIAGGGGAVVGAMIAKDKHESGGATAGASSGGTSAKHKDMVKGAAIGGLVAGDGGAVVGAMIAKDKHESGKKK